MIRKVLWILFSAFPIIGWSQSSGAVIKVGLIWNDYQRDGKSVLSRSQVGKTAGVEVRLGSADKTYFKLGGYFARMHIQPQNHPGETAFFKIEDGFDFLKGICGLETRILTLPKFNWRLGATVAVNMVVNVLGSTRFSELHSGFWGLHFNTGIDFSFLSFDIAVEPGLSDFRKVESNTKPRMLLVTLGAHF